MIASDLSYIINNLKEGLQTSVVNKASIWAERYRGINGKLWTFHGREYLREIHDSTASHIVVPKAAQLGFTESVTNVAMFHLDILKKDVLYVFPAMEDASVYSAGRFAEALESSVRMQQLFTSGVNNIKHKKAGPVNFYCRGANSRPQLKSIPVACLILDERDEMAEWAVALARERLSGQVDYTKEYDISTPTLATVGIWPDFQIAKQHYFEVFCPFCNKGQILTFEDNIRFDVSPLEAFLICSFCKKVWEHKQKPYIINKGRWVVTAGQGEYIHGYHVSQLYSMAIKPIDLVRMYIAKDEAIKVELYNSKLGLPYTPEGASLLPEEVQKIIVDKIPDRQQSYCVGIDVSADGLHWVVLGYLVNGRPIISDKLRLSWDDIFGMIERFDIRFGVIDAMPERHMTRKLCEAFPDTMIMAFYPTGIKDEYTYNEDKNTVNISRTEILMELQSLVKNQAMLVRSNKDDGRFISHLTTLTKTYKQNQKTGMQEAHFVSITDDHYAHAVAYLLTALKICPGDAIINVTPSGQSVFDKGSFFF